MNRLSIQMRHGTKDLSNSINRFSLSSSASLCDIYAFRKLA
jgi:hypothetical protein